jgi:Tfp pilus assembly protein PilF
MPLLEQLFNEAQQLAAQGELSEAEARYRQALALAPDEPALHTNLALLLAAQGQDEEAEQHQRTALSLLPDSPQIHSNLADLLAKRGSFDEAERHYREAIRLAPEIATCRSNYGVLLNDLGRYAEAEASFRAALQQHPDHAPARMNLGQLLLAQGRYAEGWPYHEARYDNPFMQAWLAERKGARCQPWRGEPLAGKAVLVLPEQGYGDEIQFCRYLPWLKAQGPARLTLVCRTPLKPLLSTLNGPDEVFTRDEALTSIDDYDYWVYPLSLPLYHGTRLDNLPAAIPYLSPDPARLAHWLPQLSRAGLRVGIAWQGNPSHHNDSDRSLPDWTPLAPLWSLPGIQFVSLQMPRESQGSQLPPDYPVTELGSQVQDFADFAAIVSQLDLVICVDSALAHLSGALGRPCWVLLPAYKTDWRWLFERVDSPWYPTLRLFRQAQRGDWAAPVAHMVRELSCLLAG